MQLQCLNFASYNFPPQPPPTEARPHPSIKEEDGFELLGAIRRRSSTAFPFAHLSSYSFPQRTSFSSLVDWHVEQLQGD